MGLNSCARMDRESKFNTHRRQYNAIRSYRQAELRVLYTFSFSLNSTLVPVLTNGFCKFLVSFRMKHVVHRPAILRARAQRFFQRNTFDLTRFDLRDAPMPPRGTVPHRPDVVFVVLIGECGGNAGRQS